MLLVLLLVLQWRRLLLLVLAVHALWRWKLLPLLLLAVVVQGLVLQHPTASLMHTRLLLLHVGHSHRWQAPNRSNTRRRRRRHTLSHHPHRPPIRHW